RVDPPRGGRRRAHRRAARRGGARRGLRAVAHRVRRRRAGRGRPRGQRAGDAAAPGGGAGRADDRADPAGRRHARRARRRRGRPRLTVTIRGMEGRRGTNLPRVADFNQAVILDAVRHAPGGLSRVELAELTGLSAQAVSNITRRLLSRELITEAGTLPAGRGKPRTLLRLHRTGHFAVGVHVDPTVTTVALLDL